MTKTRKEKLLLEMTKWDFGNVIFTIGILITIIAGILNMERNAQQIVFGTLIILGIAIGINNIKDKESSPFLIASGIIILTMAPIITVAVQQNTGTAYPISIFTYLTQSLIQNSTLYQIVINIANFFTALITPAAIIVAIKTIYKTAKD